MGWLYLQDITCIFAACSYDVLEFEDAKRHVKTSKKKKKKKKKHLARQLMMTSILNSLKKSSKEILEYI